MRTFKRILFILLALSAWTTLMLFGVFKYGYLLSKINTEDTPESFIEATKEKVKEAFVGNLSMILIEDGALYQTYNYSVDEPVDQTSVLQVASVSKWVTAWGVLKLVEQGKLDLDTPVDHYLTRWHLPESDFDNKKVTIRRLLSHSAGLTDRLGYLGYGPNEYVQTIEESLTQASDSYSEDGGAVKVGYEPGSRFMYSGGGYTLLQLVIEEVSGMSFNAYMTQAIFEPLGMTHSTFVLSDKPNLNLAQLYNADGTESEPYVFTALAAASLYTCTEDLYKFIHANLTENKVLSRATFQQMVKPESFVNGWGYCGLGPHFFSKDDDQSKVIGHDGYSLRPLINTSARVDLMSKDGIIVLEMGNHNIASVLADEWLYWKTGIHDYAVIQRNKTRLIFIFSMGCLIIIGLFIREVRKKSVQ